MHYEQIISEQDAGTLTITLNRPEKLNAYTGQMGREIEHAIREANTDDGVRAIIVTGAGRAYCAGADISSGAESFNTTKSEGAEKLFGPKGGDRKRGYGGFLDAIYGSYKPIIAAINGPSIGLGLTSTLPMDFRLASTEARFGFVFARRGLVPEAGSAWFLPRIVGLPQALAWCYSGRVFDAEEAYKGGLVSEILAPEDLLPRAREIATEIAEWTAPVAVALMRQMFWRMTTEDDPFKVIGIDNEFTKELGASGDTREGVSAFLEKRRPNFPGKVSTDMPASYPWWQETE